MWSASLLLLLLSLFLLCPCACAWHFAFGTMSWTVNATNASLTTYTVTFQQGWNSSWHWCSSGLITSPRSCATAAIAVGNSIITIGGASGNVFEANDIGPARQQSNVNNYYTKLQAVSTVTKMYPLDTVFAATTQFNIGPFPTTESYILWFGMCCRVDYLWGPNNSEDLYALISTTIMPHVPYSFNTTNPPRTYAYVNEPVPFTVQVSQLMPNQSVRFSFSPTANSGLASAIPPNMTLNSSTGQVYWNTSIIGVFPVQFQITDVATGYYIVLDTLIQTFPQTAHPLFAALPSAWQFAVSVEGVYTVQVSEADPLRVLTVTPAGGPTAASFSLLSTSVTANATTSIYAYRWTPGADDYSSTVCFQAYDDRGFFNSGNLCVTLVVNSGNLLVLSGTVRDFHSAAAAAAATLLPDFNNTLGGDTTTAFTLSSIPANATHRIPTWNPAIEAGMTTSTSLSHFSQWWNTDPLGSLSLDQSFFVLLGNNSASAINGDARVFTYSTSSFWPIDLQLFGNEGAAHNRYFTWEAHTYLTYTGGEQLQFKAADDLWVFINGQLPPGWNMQGVTAGLTSASSVRSFTVALDSMFSPTKDVNTTYPVDVFYAHRSALHDAALQIQLVAASLCNALSTGVSQVYYGFPTSSASAGSVAPVAPIPYVYGQSSLLPNAGQSLISLMPANSAFAIGVVYFGDAAAPKRLKIAHGFRCTFSFVGGGATDGFTFIMHADSPYTWGGAGGNLGYAGSTGIRNSIAVEFDGLQTNGDADPAWNHVSAHSQWSAANSAVEPGLGGLFSAQLPTFNWFNGSRFDVTVLYTAPVVGSGQQTGQLQVSVAGYNTPILVAPINATLLTQIWDGSAYVGFTAGTGISVYNSILLSNISLIAIPPSAAKSYIPAGGAPSPSSSAVAGTTVVMSVQLRDSCNNDLTIGGDEADVSAYMFFSAALPSSTPYTAVAPLQATVSGSNNDGSYQLSFTPTLAGYYCTLPHRTPHTATLQYGIGRPRSLRSALAFRCTQGTTTLPLHERSHPCGLLHPTFTSPSGSQLRPN